MRLSGISLQNFRSIGPDPVELVPLRKCNILLGQNNCGKSNILRAVKRISDTFHETQKPPRERSRLDELDIFRRQGSESFNFTLYFEAEDQVPKDVELAKLAGYKDFWFTFSFRAGSVEPELTNCCFVERISDDDRVRRQQMDELYPHLTQLRFSGLLSVLQARKAFSDSASGIFRSTFLPSIPKVQIIPEFRKIVPGDQYLIDGTNLVYELARYQNPDLAHEKDREKFDLIEQLVCNLLHTPNAKIDVTRDNPTIMLLHNGLRLPLDRYGTGVHELVILATAILSMENTICCIEEPEIHLHPRLQREFIDFIVTKTPNQYLLSTHSPAFINADMTVNNEIQLFHIQLTNGATTGMAILQDEDSLHALLDLGVKPSDILQSNCVIWVEGPSDRIYLNRWLNLVAPDLKEGLHYSVMFYGGALLAHLSLERTDVPEELIELLRVNQHAIVMIDSDKRSPRDRLRETKRRVRKECEDTESYCWITYGREVENYLSPRTVNETLSTADAQIDFQIDRYQKFDDALAEAAQKAGIKAPLYAKDKVGYARKFADHICIQDIEADRDLKRNLDRIVGLIREWNR